MRSTNFWKIEHDFQHKELEKFLFLYEDWIHPHTYKSLGENSVVLDAGSGPGIQTRLYAQYAKKVYAVDLEAIEVTKKNTKDIQNKIIYQYADIAKMNLGKKFDVVNCVGTLHHTNKPEETFNNLANHTKKNGKLILWVYSKEGNFLMENLIEPLRKFFLNNSSHTTIWFISCLLNVLIIPVVHTIYRLPIVKLPYFEYFDNYRKMSFKRNALNIYDKLNAPEQYFLSKDMLLNWFEKKNFTVISCSSYKGVSWRISGSKN